MNTVPGTIRITGATRRSGRWHTVVIGLMVLLLLITACGEPGQEATAPADQHVHPLDTIVGDKFMGEGTVRPSNLHHLQGLPLDVIQQGSLLYSVSKLNDTLYLLNQTRNYAEARSFVVLLKIKDGRVVEHLVVNDHRVRDWSVDPDSILLLCDDSENHTVHWKGRDNVLVLNLDAAFRERWRYAPVQGSHPVRGKGMSKGAHTMVRVEVVTGCSICFSVVELALDTNGRCLRAEELALHNSDVHMGQAQLNSIFVERARSNELQ